MTTYFTKHTNEFQKYIYLSGYFFLLALLFNFWFCDQWIYVLLKPLFKHTTDNYLIVTEITEIFFIKIVLMFFINCCFTTTFLIIQFWIFLSLGLFKLENYYIAKWFSLFIINFIITIYLIVTYIIPVMWIFFIGLSNNLNTYLYNYFLEPKLSTYLYFIIKIIMNFIIICQYPLIMIFCLNNNFLQINTLIQFRKIFYLGIYLLAALISPPNLEIQFSMTCLFFFIFELIIFLFITLGVNQTKKI